VANHRAEPSHSRITVFRLKPTGGRFGIRAVARFSRPILDRGASRT
jgi:hypothetical protein